jgi:hypothetical protein
LKKDVALAMGISIFTVRLRYGGPGKRVVRRLGKDSQTFFKKVVAGETGSGKVGGVGRVDA